jgi:hypothetical protein
MLQFTAAISSQRLEELQLVGNKYTWSNKQASSLLERLDWFFTNALWMASYAGSSV